VGYHKRHHSNYYWFITPTVNMISVVMTVFNEPKVSLAIDSVLQQSYQDFEIIIVDDGSTDGSREVLQKYEPSSKITLIRLEKNRGRAFAANIGVEAATGEFIARQDADDISLKTRFELQMAEFQRDGTVGAVGAGIYVNSSLGKTSNHPRLVTYMIYQKMLVNHPTLIFRRKYFQITGGYDSQLERCSDWDFCCKLFQAGCKIINIQQPLVIYSLRDPDAAFPRDAHKVFGRWRDEWERFRSTLRTTQHG